MASSRIVYGPEVVEWVSRATNEFGNYGAAVGIGVERAGEIIGGVVFNEYNGVQMNMHTAGGNGWLSRTALWYFFDYPFNQVKVKRLTALIGEGNEKSQILAEGVGFKFETSLVDAHPTGDLLIYKMFRNDCWALNLKRPRNEITRTVRLGTAA